jgi:hypothetical protein
MAGAVAATPARAVPDEIAEHVAGSARALQMYARSHAFGDLTAAVDELEAGVNVHLLEPETFVAQRRTLVRGFTRVLKTIEQSYDPTYDPNDPKSRPKLGLSEFEGSPDPKFRAWVAAEIAANPEKIRRASYYHDLMVIDMRAQTLLKVTLDLLRKVEPSGTPADFDALDGILQQAGLSAARRAKIDAMFYPRLSPQSSP